VLASKLTYFKNKVSEVGVYLEPQLPLLDNFKTVFNSDWKNSCFNSFTSELLFVEVVDSFDFFFSDIKLRQPKQKVCIFKFDDLRVLFVIREVAKVFKHFIAYISYQGTREEKRSLIRILRDKKINYISEDSDSDNIESIVKYLSKYFRPKQLRLI